MSSPEQVTAQQVIAGVIAAAIKRAEGDAYLHGAYNSRPDIDPTDVAAEIDAALGGLRAEAAVSYTPPNNPDNPLVLTDRIDIKAVRTFSGVTTDVCRWVSGWTEVSGG